MLSRECGASRLLFSRQNKFPFTSAPSVFNGTSADMTRAMIAFKAIFLFIKGYMQFVMCLTPDSAGVECFGMHEMSELEVRNAFVKCM